MVILSENLKMKNVGKAEQAFEYILKLIFEGEIVPGQRIVERSLAKQCGVSKTPVREALQRLKEMCLVTGDFQSGVYVANFTAKDAIEIFDLRECLEGLSSRLTAKNSDDSDIRSLDKIVKESDNTCRNNEFEKYSELDETFHMKLMELSRNKRLYQMYYTLRLQAQLLMRSSMRLPDRGMNKSYEEHLKIFEAIKAGDPELSEKMARLHITNTRQAVINWLQ